VVSAKSCLTWFTQAAEDIRPGDTAEKTKKAIKALDAASMDVMRTAATILGYQDAFDWVSPIVRDEFDALAAESLA
jgi:hypothetical protein